MVHEWFAGMIPPPHARESLTLSSLFRYVIPAVLCYYTTAVLVLIPHTRPIRLAILPLSLLAYFNGATMLKPIKNEDERFAYLNQGRMIVYTVFAMRTINWSFQSEPFWRVRTLGEVTPEFFTNIPPPQRLKGVLIDAFELFWNQRGCGWNWSQHIPLPRETRPTTSTRAFVTATLMSLLLHFVIFDASQFTMQWFAPTTIGSTNGGSIFDHSLPPFLRYSVSTLLTFLTGALAHCGIQMSYDVATLFGVLVFQQDPSLWPPIFQGPLLCTSITELWAKGWHQILRDVLIALGGKPLSLFFGRAGGVLGAFLLSGVFHSLILLGMGRGTDFVRVGGFFIMSGVGIILEYTWRNLTGDKVGGWYGRAWACLWMLAWGHTITEAWVTRGLVGSKFLPRSLRLTTYIFIPPSY